jgi:hypothetical protein
VNPHVFFVGCPRSGTTLLGRICAAHPDVAVVHESRWIPQWFESRDGLTRDHRVTRDLVAGVPDRRLLDAFAIDDGELERLARHREGTSFARLVSLLYDRYGHAHGASLVGDKSPGYVRYLPTLHELWPKAKFVHIIRDGRDVCLSVLQWRKGVTRFSTFADDPFTTVGVWWEWYVMLGRDDGPRLPQGLYREVRYEALVAEPEREVSALCEFLGIHYDPSMLRFHEGRVRPLKGGRSAKSAWLPVTGGLRDWRTQMGPDDVARFEAAAGDLLEDLGYERGAPSTAQRELERAARVREAFVREVEARSRPLPRAWAGVAA